MYVEAEKGMRLVQGAALLVGGRSGTGIPFLDSGRKDLAAGGFEGKG